MERKDVAHILNALRQATITWEGRRQCLVDARKKFKTNKVIRYSKYKEKNYTLHQVYKYKCAHCLNWFKSSEVEVDHVYEVGGYKGDWHDLIKRMFDRENLQCLCIECHQKKTSAFIASLDFERKV